MKLDDADWEDQRCSAGGCVCPINYIWGAIVVILLIFFIASRI